jgi:hypothetical protein
MYCQECGTQAANELAKFCAECGRKLPSATDVEDRPKKVYTVKGALTEYFQGTISESKLRDWIRQGLIPQRIEERPE